MSESLSGFSVVIEIPVAWGDMDSFGHVNNTVFFRYFESARIAWLERIEFRGSGADGIGPILASTQCRFRQPLTYPDTVTVGARATGLQADRFTHEYVMVSRKSGQVAAHGGGIIVAYDYQQGSKCAIPAAVRARIEALDSVTLKNS